MSCAPLGSTFSFPVPFFFVGLRDRYAVDGIHELRSTQAKEKREQGKVILFYLCMVRPYYSLSLLIFICSAGPITKNKKNAQRLLNGIQALTR
jgi:hypothetical protein